MKKYKIETFMCNHFYLYFPTPLHKNISTTSHRYSKHMDGILDFQIKMELQLGPWD